MLRSSGHTVLVSGTTLAICFLGLCFFPVDLLRSAGLGAALAILSTVRAWLMCSGVANVPPALHVFFRVVVHECEEMSLRTADTICFLHMAWTKSVREKGWHSRKRGTQAM